MKRKYLIKLTALFLFIFATTSVIFPSQKVNANTKSKKIEIKKYSKVYCKNARTYLRIPTYDGSNQSNHPKVLYIPNSWNGYKYWMTYTPYPNTIPDYENPSIVASNDGFNWTMPKGLKNPIIPTPKDAKMGGHNSDPHLVLNYKNNSMELWYRVNKGTPRRNPSSQDYIYKITSKDGIKWSKPVFVYSDKKLCISPAIIYENNIYKMWYVSYTKKGTIIKYAESKDSIKWQNIRQVNIKLDEGCYPWHIDVTKTNRGYEMLISNYYKAFGKNLLLSHAISNDGLNFGKTIDVVVPSKGIFSWDNSIIYRSSLVQVENKYKIYYSAQDLWGRWHIGVTEMNGVANNMQSI
ncbi:hypothetical protein [Clostridium lundense]|uniref:hypothetical protein n=1 Tax=Clostridium lundense TaxID=319475 RepID=UPI00068454DC|nr:hypothetical protein [Clostridium lundense]